jgi:hypothetical protein
MALVLQTQESSDPEKSSVSHHDEKQLGEIGPCSVTKK